MLTTYFVIERENCWPLEILDCQTKLVPASNFSPQPKPAPTESLRPIAPSIPHLGLLPIINEDYQGPFARPSNSVHPGTLSAGSAAHPAATAASACDRSQTANTSSTLKPTSDEFDEYDLFGDDFGEIDLDALESNALGAGASLAVGQEEAAAAGRGNVRPKKKRGGRGTFVPPLLPVGQRSEAAYTHPGPIQLEKRRKLRKVTGSSPRRAQPTDPCHSTPRRPTPPPAANDWSRPKPLSPYNRQHRFPTPSLSPSSSLSVHSIEDYLEPLAAEPIQDLFRPETQHRRPTALQAASLAAGSEWGTGIATPARLGDYGGRAKVPAIVPQAGRYGSDNHNKKFLNDAISVAERFTKFHIPGMRPVGGEPGGRSGFRPAKSFGAFKQDLARDGSAAGVGFGGAGSGNLGLNMVTKGPATKSGGDVRRGRREMESSEATWQGTAGRQL